MGNAPFQKKEPGQVLHQTVSRDVDKVRNLQGNNSPEASVFEYETLTLEVSDLTIGAGYAVTWQGRTRIVTKSTITCAHGLLHNAITLANEEGLKPPVFQSQGTTRRSSILTGTVLEVDGTNIKAKFQSPEDTPRWIPYANAVNNYFYCMPDIGDTVFVYYETGDSDKIVCLGSRHVNDSPDFGRYQDKMLTADNRMVKFGDKTLNLIGNRSEYDGLGGDQAKIVFQEENGIEIQSTNDITLEAAEKGTIEIQAVKEDFAGMDALRQTFEQMYAAGEDKYKTDGGATQFDVLAYLNGKRWDALKQNIKDNLMAPFQVVGTLQELAGRIGGSSETEENPAEEAPPQFDDGVIDLFGLTAADFSVGSTSVTFADGILQIKANTYLQLGTDRTITYEHLEDANYTWRDMLLDVTQLALDVVGALAPPGISTAANLISAGISLARGDYVGAAMSAGAAALSLIPFANTATAGGKIAAKAGKVAKAAKGVKEAVNSMKAVKMVKALKTGAEGLNMFLTTGMATYDVISAICSGEFSLDDPECRQDLFSILQGASTAAQRKGKKEKDGADAGTKKSKKDSKNSVSERIRAKLDERSANRCANGEPIDMVTGSYLIEQCDFLLNDITGIYAVERTYESLLSREDSPVGRGWTLSLFSSAAVYDDRVEILLPDGHTETFLKTADGYRNRRNGTKRLALEAQGEGYVLKEAETRLTRYYDADGKQTAIQDQNGNQTSYQYQGNPLEKITFASGQYLSLTWQGNKVISIEDCIGRKTSYHYEGDFLTEVEQVHGGQEQYAYDTEGRILEVTDANGVTYVHNEYDTKGRVTRQNLCNGQEYILLYDDANRTNTYLVPASQKAIRYQYNKERQLIRTQYGDGTTEEIQYDAWENRIWEKDRNGNETHRTYDAYSHLLEEIQPGGLTITLEYDSKGNCIKRKDSTGYQSQYAYDKNGNLLEEVEQIDPSRQRKVAYEYDKQGRITAFTDANGNRETYEYRNTFWEADAFTTAGGSHYEYVLDKAGRRVATASADGESTYAYNHFDLLSRATDPMGHTTKYCYDRVLDLVGIVRPNHYAPYAGNETRETYAYDAFHRQLLRKDETGAIFAQIRDGEGNLVKEINPNAYDPQTKEGEGIRYQRDADDRDYQIQYPDGGITRRWFDAAGNLIKTCSPEQYDEQTDSGAGYAYAYDSQNRLIQVTAPDGTIQNRYVYDPHGNLVKAIQAKGMETGTTDEERIGDLYTYNYLGWLLESRKPMTEEKGEIRYQLIQYQYDQNGNRIQERRFQEYQTKNSASGIVHTITYTYDKEDRLIRVSDCTGAVLEYQYDSQNRRIYEKRNINEETSQILRYRYDAAGRMTELNRTADLEGCGRRSVTVKYEYDKNGNNTRIHLPGGAEIQRAYDAADRLVKERHIDQTGGIDNTTHFAYDKAGNVTSITDNKGRKTQITYDSMNREIKRTERDGSITRQFYDRNGQLRKTIGPREYERAREQGAGEQYTYDARGNLLTVIRADGTIQKQNIYDADGQLIHTEDGMGRSIDFTYDLGGRKTKAKTGGQAEEQYQYDAMGNLTRLIDGVGNQTEYILDKWGRIVEIRQADKTSEFYAYDYAGNLTRSTDGAGNTTTYAYNGMNQLARMTDPEGNQETCHYDPEGRLCKKTDRNGILTTYTYNLYGSLLERKAKKPGDSTEERESYEYTKEGLLKTAISKGMRYSYAYDDMDRLTEKKASGRTLLALAYDREGNLTKQTDVTGTTTEYRYDLSNRITEVWEKGNCLAAYAYYPDDTIKSLHCGNLHTEYTYDADRNLASLKTTLGAEVLADNRYRYDGNGNLVEKQQKHGTTTYAYDSRNRLVTAEYPTHREKLYYDKAGNRKKRITSHTEETYQYDKRNRLTAYTKDGKTSQFTYDNAGNLLKDNKAVYEYDAFHRNTKVETFDGNIQINRYDAEGLRHEVEENGKLVSFLYRGTEVIAEETKEETIRYIRTQELLASDAEHAKTYYHYASDEMGSITHVAEESSVLNWYEYDAWGNIAACQETIENRFRFNGQQYDPVSQQYYLRARYYNPVIGRFTQEDTYRGDGLNLYAYCRNNPVYYVDLSGNICKKRANTLMENVRNGKELTRKEKRQLGAHLRDKERKVGLSDSEKKILNQVDRKRRKQETGGSESGSGSNIIEFPSNPEDFNPEGLTKIGPFETKNGKIIKWIDENKKAVFEWDEDLKYGSHYHVIGDDGNTRLPNSSGETHFLPGDTFEK